MGINTTIAWCDATHNPWWGCSVVSPGCDHCYAKELSQRTKRAKWGDSPRIRTKTLRDPYKWDKAIAKRQQLWDNMPDGDRPVFKVFCGSMMDWLDLRAPLSWFCDLLQTIYDTPHLTWFLLTKRPENFRERISDAVTSLWNESDDCDNDGMVSGWAAKWLEPDNVCPSNVWIGVSVEDQKRANERIPTLLKIPAIIHFVSCEPLLGPLDIHKWLYSDYDKACMDEQLIVPLIVSPDYYNKIRWIIVGGESGRLHRKMELSWLEDLYYCQAKDTCAFFCKQDSARFPGTKGAIPDELWNRKEFPPIA